MALTLTLTIGKHVGNRLTLRCVVGAVEPDAKWRQPGLNVEAHQPPTQRMVDVLPG
jgi:hypothetical protein